MSELGPYRPEQPDPIDQSDDAEAYPDERAENIDHGDITAPETVLPDGSLPTGDYSPVLEIYDRPSTPLDVVFEGQQIETSKYSLDFNLQGTEARIVSYYFDSGEALAAHFVGYIEARREDMHFPGDSPPNEQEAWAIREVAVGAAVIGDQLDMDLRERLPSLHDYHFFDDRTDFMHATGRQPDDPNDKHLVALQSMGVGLRILRTNDPINRAARIAHETVHDIARHAVQVHGIFFDNEGELQYDYSYTNGLRGDSRSPHGGAGANEFVTDMLASRMSRVMGLPIAYGYAPIDALGSAIVEKTATIHGMQAGEVENVLERDMLIGTGGGYDIIADALGREVADHFMRLTGRETLEDVVQMSIDLDLPAARRLIADYHLGHGLNIFNWLPQIHSPRLRKYHGRQA